MENKFLPLGNRVLVKADEAVTTTASGFVLPDKENERPMSGTIVANAQTSLSVGHRISFSRYGYDEVMLDGEKYCVVSEPNIIGIYL